MLGFRSDAAYIQESLANSDEFPEDPLAVPMTVDEAAEVARRLDVQDRIDPTAVWAEANLDGYGGMYMDQGNAGQPVFVVRQGTDVGSLLAQVPPDLSVGVREVARSLDDLRDLKAEILEQYEDLIRDGVPLYTVSLSAELNSVVVGLEKARITSSDRAKLASRFGDAVLVKATSAGSDDACFLSGCMPTRGGIGMLSTVKGNPCTIGFTVKIYQHPTLSTPRHGLLTAGHCFRVDADSGYGVQWRHELSNSSTVVGFAYEETFTENGDADAGVMTAHNTPATKNLLVWRTTGETKSITSVADNAAQNEHDMICRIGRTSQRDCGEIREGGLEQNRITTVSGYIRHLHNQMVVNIDSQGGDSGGPYYMPIGASSAKAYGIHIHSTDPPYGPMPWDELGEGPEGWFSTMEWSAVQLSSEWGVIIGACITATC
jgi:hypothetical protein